ncbi:MAG: cryptochrome/photolyase family protein [Micrococcales bacterium]
MTSLLWFRRDLRLRDHEALNLAVANSPTNSVAAVYVLELDYFESLSPIRQHSLLASVNSLRDSMSGRLAIKVVTGREQLVQALVALATELGVTELHASRMFDPAAVATQNAVGLALKEKGVHLFLTGSNYAVQPGTVAKGDGTPYKVYTPFYKVWAASHWQASTEVPNQISWVELASDTLPRPSSDAPFVIRAGEEFADQTFAKFVARALENYGEDRNRADLSGTSHLSHALSHGEIHPSRLLAQLGDSAGEIVFAKELCWREFYADVLFHNPKSQTEYYEPRFKKMRYDSDAPAMQKLEAWRQGRTGFPMVDAGMRQLLETGWMHNRVRMIVASFLVKDLHVEWQHGAAHFEQLLTDYDPASNAHGWQWTAGTGTDASPYYRVFNPVTQGYKFDPDGNYVRKYIPELRHIEGKDVHEPWNLIHGYLNDYPRQIVDHAVEREEALVRLEELKTKSEVTGQPPLQQRGLLDS